jgi:hypothetical protein
MPCNVDNVTINIPDGPTGIPVPGYGIPYALKIPDISPFPSEFPEDLLDIINKLQFLVPPGPLKPSLSINFGKNILDGIMSLLDKFFPFLMLYKFFLPLLNIIICIIEVLCSLTNPFKVIRALRRLFRVCIPEFLNLFPIFALIIMIISLLLLLLAIIEYIIQQILKLIETLLRNVLALVKSFEDADTNSVLAIAKKIGSLICSFQNVFVLLSIFNIIIQIIKDILSMLFAIPPCDDSTPDDLDNCCTPDVCPAIVKNGNYTRTTGFLQYYNKIGIETDIVLPAPFDVFNIDIRSESWQIYDPDQEIAQQFINIINAYDVPITFDPIVPFPQPKPVFFPTDSIYTEETPVKQAAYTVDLKMLYNPSSFGRTGPSRTIIFKDCIVKVKPSYNKKIYNNTNQSIESGVMSLTGGAGYEADGYTVLKGFEDDGITPLPDYTINGTDFFTSQANLNNFLHLPAVNSASPVFSPTDGYLFSNVEYTFKPNMQTLVTKNLVTAGCDPSFALNRAFINNVFAGYIGFKIAALNSVLNSTDGSTFPDPSRTQDCLNLALDTLRSNLTPEGVADFQTTANLCLSQLKDQTNGALTSLISLGFEPCRSDYKIEPEIQFTSKPIKVSVNINERNGLSLTNSLSTEVADNLARKIAAHINFGEIDSFVYDGYQSFTANLTSVDPGKGQIMLSFDDNIFCTNTIPDDLEVDPTRTLQSLDYQFVYTPVAGNVVATGEGDTDGAPERNNSDTSDGVS